MTNKSPDFLHNFDSMADSAGLRVGQVAAICGASVPSIWRWTKSGRLAAPTRIGQRVTIWRVGDVRKFLQGVAQ